MVANSQICNVKLHKGLFGFSRPGFCSFTTLGTTRFDSTITKKKTKDSSSFEADITSAGMDLDQSKFLTIEKKKFYKLQLNIYSDTAEAVFSISSISKEKRQTFLGTVLSKNDEDKDIIFGYNRDVTGIIKTGTDTMAWQFFIDNFTSGSRQTAGNYAPSAGISGGYLKTEKDSLYMQLYSSFPADLVLVNTTGDHLAALKFKQKPLSVWIRKDIGDPYQKAIATLFALIMSIKDQ